MPRSRNMSDHVTPGTAAHSVIAASSSAARIAVLTHASTDLAILQHALTQLPADFPATIGINLQGVENEARMSALLQGELADADIIVLRILGRLGSVAGFAELLRHAQRQGRHLIALSGAGEPDAELAAVSTVPADVLREALAYFHGGGSVNLAQVLRFVSDRLLLTGSDCASTSQDAASRQSASFSIAPTG